MVYNPINQLTFTLDFYQITLNDRIVLGSSLTGNEVTPSNQLVIDALNAQDVTKAQFFSNAVDTTTTGMDLVVNHYLDFDSGGELTVAVAASIILFAKLNVERFGMI